MNRQNIWIATGALGIIAVGAGVAIADGNSDQSDLGPGVSVTGTPGAENLIVELSSTLSPVSVASAVSPVSPVSSNTPVSTASPVSRNSPASPASPASRNSPASPASVDSPDSPESADSAD